MRIAGYIPRVLLGLLCVLSLPARTRAQDSRAPDQDFKVEDEDAGTPHRKTPGIFHRPQAPTPAGQLAVANALRQAGKKAQAIKQYDNLVHAWHDSAEGVTAQHALADLLLEREKYKDAFDAYQYLIDFYAGQFPFDSVIAKQFQIANVVKNQRHARFWILPGVLDPQQALPLLQAIARNGPTWERSQEALYTIALIHEDAGDYDKAAEQYERLQLRYPHGSFAASAAFSRARCLYHTSMQRGRDEGQLRTALSAYAAFMHDYPSDANAAVARVRLDEIKSRLSQLYFDRARYYDEVEKNEKAAVVAYRDFVRTFPMSNLREKAESRIAELSGTTETKR